jgi:hypothetical protein
MKLNPNFNNNLLLLLGIWPGKIFLKKKKEEKVFSIPKHYFGPLYLAYKALYNTNKYIYIYTLAIARM